MIEAKSGPPERKADGIDQQREIAHGFQLRSRRVITITIEIAGVLAAVFCTAMWYATKDSGWLYSIPLIAMLMGTWWIYFCLYLLSPWRDPLETERLAKAMAVRQAHNVSSVSHINGWVMTIGAGGLAIAAIVSSFEGEWGEAVTFFAGAMIFGAGGVWLRRRSRAPLPDDAQ